MVERLTAEAPLPDLSIFDGTRTIGDRLERLIRAGGMFVDQGQRIYRMWMREPMLSGPWAEKGAEYGARWNDLMQAALGPLATDDDAMTLLRAILEPAFFERVRGGARTTDQAAALITDMIVPWFRHREVEARSASRRAGSRR